MATTVAERRARAEHEGAYSFTITELAEEFGITPRAIRFYEDKGLLSPARNGLNRIYSRRDRGRLKLILRGKRLGFALNEIREMLDLYDLGDGQVEQLRLTIKRARERIQALEHQRHEVDQAIAELRESTEHMERLLADKLSGKPVAARA
jgi:DNA-binding transcriptional MerR regulator